MEPGWRSKPGLWTIIQGPDGKHVRFPISEKQAKVVRLMGGAIFDREAFAIDAETLYGDRQTYSTFQGKRLLVFPRQVPKNFTTHYEDKDGQE